MREYIRARLRLFEGNSPKSGGGGPAFYMPHARVGPHGEYLGVAFIDGPAWIEPGSEIELTLALMYTDTGVDYSPLQPGVHFDILEGRKVVADGVVLTRWTEDGDWKSHPEIMQEEALTQAETDRLYGGLLARDPIPRRYESLVLTLRTPQRQLVGALLGATMWNWLSIDALWVDESHRGRGFGQSMVREAERIAAQRGCTRARLDTFDFQARSFYERMGYRVYAQLDDYPEGHTHFHLSKSIITRT